MDTPELDVTRWNPYDRNCPTRKLLDRIGDRWTVLIIGTLQHGPQRFGELKTRVDYELTDLGRTLIAPLAGLEEWARTHMQQILDARGTIPPSRR